MSSNLSSEPSFVDLRVPHSKCSIETSIIMPAYNVSEWIEEAIESVIAQRYTNWELVIVDDASTDHTAEIIQNYTQENNKIKSIYHKNNKGAYAARNTGLAIAQGRFIAFLDADDLWRRDKLSRQIVFMKKNGIAFSYTNYIKHHQNNNKSLKIQCSSSINYMGMIKMGGICNSSVVLDSQLINQDIVFPVNRNREDFALWLLLLKNSIETAFLVPEELTIYRKRKKSLSANKLKMFISMYHVYRRQEKFSIIRSLKTTLFYSLDYLRKRQILF